MPSIFISHASANNAEALALGDWLLQNGWSDYFLDIDPARGIGAGDRWQAELRGRLRRSQTLLVLISHEWLKSSWSRAEYLLAENPDRTIIGLLLDVVLIEELPPELRAERHICDLFTGAQRQRFQVGLDPIVPKQEVSFAVAGLERLKLGLQKVDLRDSQFPWPPPDDPERSPYAGLKPLEAADAAVFFGRDAEIERALSGLRTIQRQANDALFVVVGASGAGKSSFVRAGLWPRLRRDDARFLVLPILRPERAALNGPAGLVNCLTAAFRERNAARNRADVRALLERPNGFAQLLAELHSRAQEPSSANAPPQTILLAIDQGEELFAQEGSAESEALLQAIAAAITERGEAVQQSGSAAAHLIVVVALRSHSLERLQNEPRLAGLTTHLFGLPPLARSEYKTIIEGPARVAAQSGRALRIEPALAERLLQDTEGADAVPLLAFTLERLLLEHGADGELSVADYDALGGVRGSIEAAISAAFDKPNQKPRISVDASERLRRLRQAFIPWLARVDPDTEERKRRVAEWRELPRNTHGLMHRLVAARLLVQDVRARDSAERSAATLEVAHEALLRQWTELANWLDHDAGALKMLESVRRAAAEWTAQGRRKAWLLHSGERLELAESLQVRADFHGVLDNAARDYLRGCRAFVDAAQAQRQAAESRAIVGQASVVLAEHPQLGLLLAAHALERATARSAALVLDVQAAVHAAVAKVQGRPLLGLNVHPRSARVSYDGAFLAWIDGDGAHLCRRASADEFERVALPPMAGEYGEITWCKNALVVARWGQSGDAVWVCPVVNGSISAQQQMRFAAKLIGHSSHNNRLALQTSDKTILIVSADGGTVQTLRTIPGVAGSGLLAFTVDGARCVFEKVEPQTRRLELWDLDEAAAMQVLDGLRGVETLIFSPDGQWLFGSNTTPQSGGSGAESCVWHVPKNRPVQRHGGILSKNVAIAEFSPDSRWLAVSGWNDVYQDEYVRLWRLDPAGLASALGHSIRQIEEINSVAFSADSRWLISASRFDRNAFIWDLEMLGGLETECAESSFLPLVLGAHDKGVHFATFAGTVQTVITLSTTGRLRQFELRRQTHKRGRGLEIWHVAADSSFPLLGHEAPITAWTLSGDQRTLLTFADGETARAWRLPASRDRWSEDVIAEAHALAGRTLTATEEALYIAGNAVLHAPSNVE